MKVLVVLPVESGHKKLLEEAGSGCELIYSNPQEVSVELLHSVDAIIGNVPPAKLAGTEKLKWLQLNSAGTDGYLQSGVLPAGAVLTNATGAYGLAISEHMIASLLCLMKKLHLYQEDQSQQLWGDRGNVTSIEGAKVLVIGMGDIGGDFARKMHALGARVTGIRRTQSEKPDYLEAIYTLSKLPELIGEMDIVALSLPGTAETVGLFDADMLGRMKQGAFLVNVGRGTAVDSLALAEALNSGHLAGAAVDVTNPEPLPQGHPLWTAKNALITPHISGFYHLPETFERIVRIAAENLAHLQAGEPLRNTVDFQTGYRKR